MERKTLKQYKDIYLEIKELNMEIEDMERDILSAEGAVGSADDLRAMVKGKTETLIMMRRDIEESFELLTSLERRLLRKKYFLGKANRIIASEMCMGVDNVKRIHTKVLKKIEGAN